MSKSAIILGAAGGIGSLITEHVIDNGYTVLGTDLSEEDLSSNASVWGDRFTPYRLDLDNEEEVREFIDKATSIGLIDLIINSAGFIDEGEPSYRIPAEIIRRTFNVNISSIIEITQSLLPHLSENAQIFQISSTAALWGNPSFPIYSASKAALNTYCRATAKRLMGSGKSIFCVCPGPTNTKLRERIARDASKQQDPVFIAKTVEEIINGATAYKNGDIIVVRDGKESLHSSLD